MKQSQLFNAEIKARCHNPEAIRDILISLNADFKGIDHQVDHYFSIPKGRLKLREGNIENTLIYYDRVESKGVKESHIELVRLSENQVNPMLSVLNKLYQPKVQVVKDREIFFIENVKFHIDRVEGLGHLVEIEAINLNNEEQDFLIKQCSEYQKLFRLEENDLINKSYADMK